MKKPISDEKAFQNTVKDALSSTNADAIICRKNGTVEIRRSYFYRFGATATSYADQIRDILSHEGIPANVTGDDRWAAWPKTSYFVAIISPVFEPKYGN